jgi:hypothetical protein
VAVYTPKRLGQAQASTSDSTLYTVPASTSAIIKEIVVCNTTSGSVAFDVAFVAAGGSVGDSTRVIRNHTIQAYSTVIYAFSQVLATGGFVSAKAGTATSLTVTASGVEFA